MEYFFEVFLERILRRDRHALFGIGKDEEMISELQALIEETQNADQIGAQTSVEPDAGGEAH